MSKLSEDELALILNWLTDPKDRKSFSEVCKQWLRVEGHARISLRILDLDLLHNFLPRFPNLHSLDCPRPITNSHLHFLSTTCPNLQFLNFNLRKSRHGGEISDSDDLSDDGIRSIANGCPGLTKVLLRRRKNVSDDGVVSLVEYAENLTNLDLGRCGLVSDESLRAIGELGSIQVLNLEGCSLVTDGGLYFLATGSASRSLKRLILAECDRVTDYGILSLVRMLCLEELNLAECGPKVTDIGAMALASILSLKKLNFSWLINISDVTLVAIAENCRNLVALDLTGCEMITGAGIRAFANHDCLESLVLASCYSFCGDDVNMLVGCKSLSYIILDKGLRMWIPAAMQENISRYFQINWR